MVVQHNISAMNANRYFGINNSGLSKSLEKLSSGFAINRAGDNAAGLAVSEKMRAQISGLTQATKNAQDGISMVQTFEGALTETDSILQRMRTLAVQSANGTYQDDVDREAIQLEFDQLNDELNQIADTDFNGVVVLNGGQMADGVKAVNGKFDYANADREPTDLGSNSKIFNTVDENSYNSTMAAGLWTDLGLDQDNVDSIDVTFKFDGNGWVADKSSVAAANLSALDITSTGTGTKDTNNGGFTVESDTMTNPVSVVLDGTDLKAGDTVTLTFTNPKSATVAPENGGFADDSVTVADTKGNFTADKITASFTKGAIAAADMSEDLANSINNLNGVDVKLTVGSGDSADYTAIEIGGVAIGTLGGKEKITIGDYAYNVTASADGSIVIEDVASGKTIGTWTLENGNTAGGSADGADAVKGTVTGKLAIDTAKYDTAAQPDVSVKADMSKVSESNSNNASTATMTYTDNITLQTGARTKDSVNFTFSYASNGLGDLKADLDCSARGLGTDKLSLSTQEGANAAIDKIDNAINKVSMVRASFGAMQNRLEHKIANLEVNTENLTAAESRIRDTDMAKEMTNFTKNQILSQASQAMLAQANQLPQGVLQLLG